MRPLALLAMLCAAGAAAAMPPPPAQDEAGQDRITGEEYVRQGRFDLSIPFLIEATKRDPMVADLHVYLAFALRNVGRLDEAGAHYRFALRLEPENRWALAYYGVMLLEQGERAEATEMLATLRRVCETTCPERDELERAFAPRS
ncbi:tetratricopeptide repeat protein [Elioraea rosea]|uniref:tetratricopeptide repeat protein n=1 Tax=Elioraea rosea TaxID=2492390 RepID=UPI00118394E7|nr:tetratricopeptide repeat protein [Elioraea rosea]